MTNEWGPPLTGDEMKALKGRIDPGTPVCLLDPWEEKEVYSFWNYDSNGYHLPTNHPYYKVREHNQTHSTNLVLHGGSAKVPEDWDEGGFFLKRNGQLYRVGPNPCWEWYVRPDPSDIIAYTPKPKESEWVNPIGISDHTPPTHHLDVVRGAMRIKPKESEVTEEFPSDEAIEYVLRQGTKNNGKDVMDVKGNPNYYYPEILAARLIQQYEPDRLKPAVDVAAEAWATSEGMFNPDYFDAFKAGAAWQKDNGK